MKKTLLFVLAGGIVAGFALNNDPGEFSKYHQDDVDGILSSVNPPAEKTGAPGENTCTQCHTGNTFSAAGTVNYNFSGANDEYYPGQSYTIDLSIASGAKNGFKMTILDGSDTAAGTFTAGTGSGTTSANGREYIRQTDANNTNWSFTWNAPATDMGDLTVYYTFNKTNNASNTAGDSIFVGQETISIAADVGIETTYEQLKNGFNPYFDQAAKEIVLNFQTLDYSNITLHVYDLNGRRIINQDYGMLNADSYTRRVDASEMTETGVYLVSLFIDNYVVNKKIFIH